ncbi:hypothetical protein GCM10023196_003130 [Actinoallomurus vinaceus]|uniref:Uncharacterized protein n=1 Tax=Actinoallomurus vinaceus TaxID=1080074 RepID=A0ABP8U1E5_9ACTN
MTSPYGCGRPGCRRHGGDVHEHPASDDGTWLSRIAAEADFEPDPLLAEVHGVCGRCLRSQGDGLAG